MDETEKSELEIRREQFEARRATRNKAHQAAQAEQELNDLEAIFELEEEHGVSRVAKVRVPFTPGLPCYVAVRCPSGVEMKRYRDMAAAVGRKGQMDPAAATKAAEALASSCLIYPAADVYDALKAERPGIHALAGAAAVHLAVGEVEAEGKD